LEEDRVCRRCICLKRSHNSQVGGAGGINDTPTEAEAVKAKAEQMKPIRIEVQVGPVTPRDPQGRTTPGFYTLDGNVLTMTDGEGAVVRDRRNGELYQEVLKPDQNPRSVATRLTREIWKANQGGGIPGFYGPINYSNRGIV
jgi:hypothetical protein